VNAVESDPSVSAFAKTVLPTCGVGEVLKSNGSSLSCVTDASGGGAFSGTANRALVTNGSGAIVVSTITDTVLGYLSGVTSDIQTQINSKLASGIFVDWSAGGMATLDPTRLNLTTANRVVITNGTSTPIASTVTTTELGYVSGVTSSIQTQLNSKLSSFTETDPSVTAFAKAALPTCNTGEVLKSNGTSFSCVTDNAGAGSYAGGNNFVVVTNGAGALSDSTISTTQLGYLSTTTSDIQTQLNAKQATITTATAITSGSIQTNLQNAVAVNPYNTAAGNTGEVRFYELLANGTNYTGFKSPDLLAGDVIYTLPAADGSVGQILRTDGAGVLSWVADNAGGGAFSGTASKAVVTDGGGALTTIATTSTELGYVAGVTSAIQTQLNAKQASGNYVTALTGDVTATGPGSVAATVAQVGGVTAANVATGANLANAATNVNTASTIVKRDASGNFTAGTITATLNGTATNVTGTVAVANGGTGATTLELNQLLFGNGVGVIGTLATTSTPSILLSAVTTGAPTWTTSTAGNVLKGSVTGVQFGALAQSDLPAGSLSGAGTVNYVPYYNATNTLANSPLVVNGGNVGIGTAVPSEKLTVQGNINTIGQISSTSFSASAGAIDYNLGNSGTTSFDCTNSANEITFANLKNGGTYNLVVLGSGTSACNFSTTTTGTNAATVTYRFKPSNGVRIASSHTIYSFMRVGNTVYVSWATGF
jgi:hypothetical protein